jgi:hypothetical protein
MNLEVITQYSKSLTWKTACTYGTTKIKIPETELENEETLKTDKNNLKLPTKGSFTIRVWLYCSQN